MFAAGDAGGEPIVSATLEFDSGRAYTAFAPPADSGETPVQVASALDDIVDQSE